MLVSVYYIEDTYVIATSHNSRKNKISKKNLIIKTRLQPLEYNEYNDENNLSISITFIRN